MMESTCKQLVGQRLKGPGMHWIEQGAIAITALRATDLNGKWNSFWNPLALSTCAPSANDYTGHTRSIRIRRHVLDRRQD